MDSATSKGAQRSISQSDHRLRSEVSERVGALPSGDGILARDAPSINFNPAGHSFSDFLNADFHPMYQQTAGSSTGGAPCLPSHSAFSSFGSVGGGDRLCAFDAQAVVDGSKTAMVDLRTSFPTVFS